VSPGRRSAASLERTSRVPGCVTSLRLSLVQGDECVEVFGLMRLPELDGECGDLTAGVARVNCQAAPGVAERVIQPFGIHEEFADVRVNIADASRHEASSGHHPRRES
jgi:hypothetical protein